MEAPATHCDRALDYADAVVAGEIPACHWVRQACQRQIDDLDREPGPAFPYRFDPGEAERVCQFLQGLHHVKGKWAVGKPEATRLLLEPWQSFLVTTLFGWVHVETGKRRFRRAYIELPRKNGKSILAAGIGLYMLTADGEQAAEVYCGATSERQAWMVFEPARRMAQVTPELRKTFALEVNASNLAVIGSGSRFEPVVHDPGDGTSPHLAVVDEYHEHATDRMLDSFRTGMAAREQPLLLVITTAGVDTASPCYALHTEMRQVLDGHFRDEVVFALMYGLDEGDDWTTEAALAKANPNWGVSVIPDVVLAEQAEAVRNARKQGIFSTKHLNVWMGSREPYFNLDGWHKLADDSLDVAQFAGEPCWMGMDLASKSDFSSVCALFRRDIEGTAHYYAFWRHYLPEDTATDPAKQHYLGWVKDGHVLTTDGAVIDFDVIGGDVMRDATLFGVRALGYDQWGATQLATQLGATGLQVVEVAMNTRNLSEPMKWVEAMIRAGRLHHNGDPVAGWMLGNTTAKIDANDNVFPRKERPENKIDGAVALIIAMGRAMADDGSSGRSIYETEGLTLL